MSKFVVSVGRMCLKMHFLALLARYLILLDAFLPSIQHWFVLGQGWVHQMLGSKGRIIQCNVRQQCTTSGTRAAMFTAGCYPAHDVHEKKNTKMWYNIILNYSCSTFHVTYLLVGLWTSGAVRAGLQHRGALGQNYVRGPYEVTYLHNTIIEKKMKRENVIWNIPNMNVISML